MKIIGKTKLKKMALANRRRGEDRRERIEDPTLSTFEVFSSTERSTFRQMDRRRTLRRERDVQRRTAGIGGVRFDRFRLS